MARNVIEAVINTLIEKCLESPAAQRVGGTAVSTHSKVGKVRKSMLKVSAIPDFSTTYKPALSGWRKDLYSLMLTYFR